jgi:DNA-binding NtrC family response regulator
MTKRARILLIDDDEMFLRSVSRSLANQGYDVVTAANGRSGLARMREGMVDLALVDWHLPDMNGAQVVVALRLIDKTVGLIAITGDATGNTGFQFLRAGANRYFSKRDINSQVFFDALSHQHRIVAKERSRATSGAVVTHLSPPLNNALAALVGQSAAMRELKANIGILASLGRLRQVLLTGESGVGKTLAARALHAARGDGDLPFVEQNCANLTTETIGPALFGTEAGVYSEVKENKGAFAAANGGTLFLDEIGTVPMGLQAQLLTVVQDRIYSKMGSPKTYRFKGLLIFATNEKLRERVNEQTFRRDLLFRINTHRLRIPPLRERLDDVPTLAYYFLDKYVKEYDRDVRHISAEAMELLCTHRYADNNVRELESIIDRAVSRGMHRYLEPEHLEFENSHDPVTEDEGAESAEGAEGTKPPVTLTARAAPTASRSAPAGAVTRVEPAAQPAAAAPPLRRPHAASGAHPYARFAAMPYSTAKDELLEEWTRGYCRHMLARSNGNKTLAAEYAGMARPNFLRLLRRYEVDTAGLTHQDLIGGLTNDTPTSSED